MNHTYTYLYFDGMKSWLVGYRDEECGWHTRDAFSTRESAAREVARLNGELATVAPPDTNKIEDGGPAFPFHYEGHTTGPEVYYGLTIRQYAAIHLKVPNSGTPWLDEMIRAARRDEWAGKAMAGLVVGRQELCATFAEEAHRIADAMEQAGKEQDR